MKKKIIIALFLSIFSISIAKSVSIKEMAGLLKILTKMSTTQMGMNLEMVEDGIKQAQSLQNQAEMIQYEVQNLKKLGQDISQGNITSINRLLEQIEEKKGESLSLLNNQAKLISDYRDIYKKNPEAFADITGYDDKSLAALKKQVTRAQDHTNNMLYDAVTQAGYSAKLGNDTYNLNSLLEASKTTTGALEVAQITNNLLGTQQATLLEIRQLLETNLKIAASVESNKNTEGSADKASLKLLQEDLEVKSKAEMKKINKATNKKITIGG